MTQGQLPPEAAALLNDLEAQRARVSLRERRYRGDLTLKYASTEIADRDIKRFAVNLNRIAVDAVAERMRVKGLTVTTPGGRDMGPAAWKTWTRSNLDQLLQPFLVDVLALGSAYLMVWTDPSGRAVITPESCLSVTVRRDPLTGRAVEGVKQWDTTRANGEVPERHVVHYTETAITHYTRDAGSNYKRRAVIPNPLNVVPLVPVVNFSRIGDTTGTSVLDDLGPLVDALSKVIADMLVASEEVARPRRWATGVDLEEDTGDGFTADGGGFMVDPVDAREQPPAAPDVVSPFSDDARMFTVESPDARIGQLPGADLGGYRTAVDLLTQQIMAVAALPAHMVGITGSNVSADAFRAAEASLTARADSRIPIIGMAIERAVALATSIETGLDADTLEVTVKWANTSTRSLAAEADSAVKLAAENIITTEEARALIEAAELRRN